MSILVTSMLVLHFGAGEVTTAGEDPGSAASSYGATAASPVKLARIRTDNQVVLYLVVLTTMHTLLVKLVLHMTIPRYRRNNR